MRDSDRWLAFAKEDLRVAELAMGEGLYNQVCFHAEQCVEKALNGWLATNKKGIPRTHSMADLLPLIPTEVVADMAEEILLLDRFYIPTRYPDALPGSLEEGLPTKEEAQGAYAIPKRLFEYISQML
jgi:HEPN domain-containing protein